MKDATTSCPETATLTEAELFKRFMDAPPRVGEIKFPSVWEGTEHTSTAREWILEFAGKCEYPLDGAWAERLLDALEESDAPSHEMDQMIGGLNETIDAMNTLQRAYSAMSSATPMTPREADPERLALLFAIAQMQSLPRERQDADHISVCCWRVRSGIDCALLADLLFSVEQDVEREINLWPHGGGCNGNGEYSEDQITLRDTVRARVNEMKERFSGSRRPSNTSVFDVLKPSRGVDDREWSVA